MKTAFITGTSSGLGRGLAETLSRQGWRVYGCSRRGCDLPGMRARICDLSDYDHLPAALDALLAHVDALDLVVLNAGVLGEIGHLTESPLEDLKRVMEINLWANKAVMDWLHGWGGPIDQIVIVTPPGAARGVHWGS